MNIHLRIQLLFLLSAMLASLHANSQSFVLRDENNFVLNNGDTIVVTGPDSMMLEAPILAENTSSVGKFVQVQRIDLNVVPGADCFMMWGTWEYPSSVMLTPEGDSIGAFMINSSFMSAYISHGVPGSSWYEYIFFDENNPSDSAWAVIQYNTLATTGIKANTLIGVSLYPNPGNGIFNLSFSFAAPTGYFAEVFNSTGDLISSTDIEATASLHCIDIRKYKTGIYFLKMTDHENNVYKIWKIVKL
jgi:hypothetical protein